MKFITYIVFLFSFLGCKTCSQISNITFLNEETPTNEPIGFMEHLVPAEKLIHKRSFNPELNEYYYTLSDKEYKQFDIYVIKKVKNNWSTPELAFFNSKFRDHGMCFSPNGTSIYFSSTRPTNIDGVSETWHIWKSDKIKDKWNKPVYVDIPNLRNKLVAHPTITNSGKLYFHSSNLDYSEMDIYESKNINGKFEDAVRASIHTKNQNIQKCTPFVSTNEDYLLFASIGKHLALMIAFNDGDGNWINTRKLNDTINTNGQGNPYITPDEKFLFYTTGNPNEEDWKVNWVNIENEMKIK